MEIKKIIEELEKTIKEEVKKDYYKEKEEVKEIFLKYENKDVEKLHEELNRIKEEEQKEKEKEERRKIKELVLVNNLYYVIYNNIFEDVKELFKKYENKNIGEQTKEKITNEFTQYINKKYNINCNLYITRIKESWENTFKYDFTLDLSNYFRYYYFNSNIKMTRQYWERAGWVYNKYYTFSEYITDIENYTNNLLKNKKEIEEKQEEINKLKNNFNSNLHNFIYDNYKIN